MNSKAQMTTMVTTDARGMSERRGVKAFWEQVQRREVGDRDRVQVQHMIGETSSALGAAEARSLRPGRAARHP